MKTKKKTASPRTVQRCAAQHMGPWAVHPQWFAQAVAAVKAGTFKPNHQDGVEAAASDPNVVGEMSGDFFKVRYYIEPGGIARVPFFGQVTKGSSSFGGASSVWTRQSIRKAIDDDRITAILLHVDSPGGTVSGAGDLADDVKAADDEKPVYTYIEDLGASAAYWIGCQARKVFANPTALVGSIGTMTYVEDTSGAYEKAGIKVTLIATGPLKGQWVDGNPVSEEYIASVRQEVEDLNAHFQAGVTRGRGLEGDDLAAVSDGQCFIASKAQQLGLVDDVCTLQAAMAAIQQEISAMPITPDQFSAHAAENPTAAEVQALVTQGYEQAKGDLAPKAATIADLEAAFPNDGPFVLEQLKAGATMPDATAAYVAKLRQQLTEQTEAHAKAIADKDAAHAEAVKALTEANEDLSKRLAAAPTGNDPVSANPDATGDQAAKTNRFIGKLSPGLASFAAGIQFAKPAGKDE